MSHHCLVVQEHRLSWRQPRSFIQWVFNSTLWSGKLYDVVIVYVFVFFYIEINIFFKMI